MKKVSCLLCFLLFVYTSCLEAQEKQNYVGIKNIKWHPAIISLTGCMKGGFDYLCDMKLRNNKEGDAVKETLSWISGASGYAFVLNIQEQLDASGPTSWNYRPMFELLKNIGMEVNLVFAHKNNPQFEKVQEQACNMVRKGLGEGNFCIAFDMKVPEYYIINGVDDKGYYYRGAGAEVGAGPMPVDKLGDTDIGLIIVASVKMVEKADDEKTIMDALEFAVEFSKPDNGWAFPKYKAGISGYDLWIDKLKDNKADHFGMAYNAAAWAECRKHAVFFLEEAAKRIGSDNEKLFDPAIKHYIEVYRNLSAVSEMFPFLNVSDELMKQNMDKEGLRKKAMEYLKKAKKSEQLGILALKDIIKKLNDKKSKKDVF